MSKKWAVNNTVTKNIQDLIEYDSNPREHAPEQIQQVAESIKEFGWTMPILIDETNEIIAGHGRLLAGKQLGIQKVPCIIAKGWSEEQKKAYCIADNKLTENSTWSKDLLKLNLTDLYDQEFDLKLTGFSEDELSGLLPDLNIVEGLTDEDDVPEVSEEPVTKNGDVWICGEHKAMCGDSTSINAVKKLMNSNKADILFTDPPYNIDFKPQRGTHDKILNDSMDESSFDDFLDGFLSCSFAVMNPNTYAFIFTGWSKLGAFERAIKKVFNIQAFHIWVKNNFGIGYYSRPKHEPFYLCLNGEPIKPDNAPADVWEEKKVYKTIHSCEKPVDLITRILDVYNKNGLVLDLFGGSGSTLIACEKTNRKCYVMELDPKYCDVIVKRWQNYTGKEAVLESDGTKFNDLLK